MCATISAADAGKALGDTVGTGTPIDTNLTKSHFCEFTSTGGAAKGKISVEITANFPVEADWVAQMGKIGLTDSLPNVGDKAFYRKAATDGGRISVHKGALVYWVVVDKPGATPDQLLPGMTEIVNKLLTIS